MSENSQNGANTNGARSSVKTSGEKNGSLTGERIGRFEILTRLGKGGMGEVYLARDKSLARDVAIKVLLPEFTTDLERVKRFRLEAKAASALNHPNIITIYEIGEEGDKTFIATEYVRGETLSAMLEKSRLPVERAVNLAVQIVSALEEAHDAGIVHRDIKPSNIIVNQKEQAKVLDFGLAKMVEEKTDMDSIVSLSSSGAVMGTIPYMSPEQLRGETVDRRADIFSFGAVFYEMLTGISPFRMRSNADTISAILKEEPKLERIPPALRPLIEKALSKNKETRYQTASELLDELQAFRENSQIGAITGAGADLSTIFDARLATAEHNGTMTNENTAPALGESVPETFEQTASVNRRLWASAAVVTLMALGGYLWWNYRTPVAPAANDYSVTQLTSWKRDLDEAFYSSAQFSPDGKLLAFPSTRGGVNAIWLKQIGGGEPFTRKQDQWPEHSPVFSPDGQQIAFISTRDGQYGIWSMPTLGGPPVLLKNLEGKDHYLRKWSNDGSKIYYEHRKNIFQLDLISKEISQLTKLDDWPITILNASISYDETKIAFVARQNNQSDIWTVSKDGGEPVRVTDDEYEDSNLFWHPDGNRIIYNSVRNNIGQIFTVATDGNSPSQIIFSDSPTNILAISPDGKKIVYSSQREEADLWKVDLKDAKETRLTQNIGIEIWPAVSPDGKSFVYQGEKSADIFVKVSNAPIYSQLVDVENEPFKLTDDGGLATWSPDGKTVSFLRHQNNLTNLWIIPSNGGSEKSLTTEGISLDKMSTLPYVIWHRHFYQWSPDSRSLVYCAVRNKVANVWQVSNDGTGEEQLTFNNDPQFYYTNPTFSSDGKTIIYLRFNLPRAGQKDQKWSVWKIQNNKTEMLYETEVPLSIVGWAETPNDLIIKAAKPGQMINNVLGIVDLIAISTETRQSRTLFELSSTYLNRIYLSPNQQTLAFVSRSENYDAIKTISIKGEQTKEIIRSNDPRFFIGSLTWAPNNSSLFFGKQANWQIVSMIENYK